MKLAPVTLAALAVSAGGCGDEPERASTQTPVPAATATATATQDGAASAAVTIRGFAYDPARVTVRPGGKVTWTDEDAANHTVTFSDDGPEDIGNLREGRSATVEFEKRGTYAYVCDFHPGMAGTVVVG